MNGSNVMRTLTLNVFSLRDGGPIFTVSKEESEAKTVWG